MSLRFFWLHFIHTHIHNNHWCYLCLITMPDKLEVLLFDDLQESHPVCASSGVKLLALECTIWRWICLGQSLCSSVPVICYCCSGCCKWLFESRNHVLWNFCLVIMKWETHKAFTKCLWPVVKRETKNALLQQTVSSISTWRNIFRVKREAKKKQHARLMGLLLIHWPSIWLFLHWCVLVVLKDCF